LPVARRTPQVPLTVVPRLHRKVQLSPADLPLQALMAPGGGPRRCPRWASAVLLKRKVASRASGKVLIIFFLLG